MKIKENNPEKKIPLRENSSAIASKWTNLTEQEKIPFINKFNEENNKYIKELALVKHYIFHDYKKNKPPTAYELYINKKLIEALINDNDEGIDKIKAKARDEWKKMPDDEKKLYKEKKKENDAWLEKAKEY